MMARLQMPAWQALVVVAFLLSSVAGLVSFNPTNSSFPGPSENLTVYFTLSSALSYEPHYSVYPFNSAANFTADSPGISGAYFVATPSTYTGIPVQDVVFLSCDTADYPGLITASTIFAEILTIAPRAVVLYSQTANSCQPSENVSSLALFTMAAMSSSQDFIQHARQDVYTGSVYLASRDRLPPGPMMDNNSTSSSNNNNNVITGTATTMIILYAIVGAITLLFMFIVIAGAVRAHRNIDRYGRQVVNGRVQQSRAGGLARAMLDTLPIVKFSQRQPVKSTDVEMGPPIVHEAGTAKQPEMTQQSITTPAEGIAAAVNETASAADLQGCSICTEDFEVGQDLRVLPCDHRYHPACVDPWLLNVSATCPLCRIDLRPAEEQEEPEQPVEASPTSSSSPTSRRRSTLMAITGFRIPERMTREERIAALNQYRQNNTSGAPAPASSTEQVQAPIELVEVPTRGGLRRLANIRTWRLTRRSHRG